MSASPPQPVRPLAALAAGAASLLVASALARITEIGGITLGLLSPRLGHAVVAAGASGALGILFGRRAMPAGRALLGAALFLSAVQTLGLEATRRRQTLMAAGVGAVTMAVGLTLRAETRRASSKRWIPCAHGAITVGSALGVAWLVDLDGRPYRIELPPIPSKEAPPTAPDIVLITMDTTVHGAVTPSAAFPFQGALNAFRDEAVEFRRVSAEASHTHPSMASLATSRWPLEHGSISTSPGMDPRLPTLAEHVRAHGYRTAGFVENPWLGPGFGLDRGFEFLARRARLDDIEEWLGADDARPAFLHVHLFEPHGPYELRPWALELLGRPVDSKARARLGDTIDARFIRDGEVPGAHSLTSADFEWLRTIYFTEVVAMDRWIGSFLELLESRDPGSQHTIIAITSDHGEEFGEHGALHHSHTLYGELVHVPLLVRSPGERPRVDERPAGLIDIAPTLLDAAGLPPLPGAAGHSLFAAPLAAPRALVATRFHERGSHLLSIELGEWKLHRRVPLALTSPADPLGLRASDVQTELYRVSTDPGEQRDVANDHGETVAELLAAARDWQREAIKRMREDDERYGRATKDVIGLDPGIEEALRGFGYSLDEEEVQAPR